MNWIKRKQEEKKAESVVEPEVPETPETPLKEDILMSVKLVNNRTDAEYIIASTNEFGLDWTINEGRININQNMCYKKQGESEADGWLARGRFFDFSVVDCFWETREENQKKDELV